MRALLLTIAVLLATIDVRAAGAAEWHLIRPGTSTQADVRTQFGQATKVTSAKVDGYDTAQWLYEAAQAPPGMVRVTIDFGLLTPQGYRADVVRVMRLELRPEIFNRSTVLAGWGPPQRIGRENDGDVFFYESGLLVYFEKSGWLARTMIFTPPQPPAGSAAPPPR